MGRLISLAILLVCTASLPAAPATATNSNQPPTAAAGLDQTVASGTTVYLDAGGSHDADGEITGTEWRIRAPNGSTVTPSCQSCTTPTFTPDATGRWAVSVTVTDDDGGTDSDTLYVTVEQARGPSVTLTVPDTVPRNQPAPLLVEATARDASLQRVELFHEGARIDRFDADGDSTAVTTNHAFLANGSTELLAAVTDATGRVSTATGTVEVVPSSDVATEPSDGSSGIGSGDCGPGESPVWQSDEQEYTCSSQDTANDSQDEATEPANPTPVANDSTEQPPAVTDDTDQAPPGNSTVDVDQPDGGETEVSSGNSGSGSTDCGPDESPVWQNGEQGYMCSSQDMVYEPQDGEELVLTTGDASEDGIQLYSSEEEQVVTMVTAEQYEELISDNPNEPLEMDTVEETYEENQENGMYEDNSDSFEDPNDQHSDSNSSGSSDSDTGSTASDDSYSDDTESENSGSDNNSNESTESVEDFPDTEPPENVQDPPGNIDDSESDNDGPVTCCSTGGGDGGVADPGDMPSNVVQVMVSSLTQLNQLI